MNYRIDELAREAGTTVRNVRAYQERGLLPAPRREGRVAWYSHEHLARLRVIGALLERGYSLSNIAEMVSTWEAGGNLQELLGLEQAVTTPFSDEAPTTLRLDELAELFGTIDPAAVLLAVKLGVLSIEGTSVRVSSLRVLKAGAELHKAGIALPALLREIAAVRKDAETIANRFVTLVEHEAFDPHGEALPSREAVSKLAELVTRARPLAEVVVVAELAHALERLIRTRLAERLGRLVRRPSGEVPGSTQPGHAETVAERDAIDDEPSNEALRETYSATRRTPRLPSAHSPRDRRVGWAGGELTRRQGPGLFCHCSMAQSCCQQRA